MPLYEYLCSGCKKKMEVLQGFDEKPIRNCPHCGGKLKKLMSSPAIQFKGSGWYVTDYAGKSGSADSADKSPAKAAESDSKGSKESTKAEAKKPEKPSKKESASKKE